MAETAGRENLIRRPSFRKSLAEAGLPQEYLDQLEQKRKQLDESIHKYIAAKEREYKQFEKDLRAQHRAQGPSETSNNNAQPQRRASAEEAAGQSPLSAIDTLMRKGSRRDSDNNAIEEDARSPSALAIPATTTNPNDRRTSDDRQEFVGVFIPGFLPALNTSEDERTRSIARTASAPDMPIDKEDKNVREAMQRANSDTVVLAPQAQAKRPMHLQQSQRTSSSGSSIDGKLISAMKSPSDAVKPKRKRVSLAVGDAIVAPSDNVPLVVSNNSVPSHSRSRTTPPSSQTSSPSSGSPVKELPQQFVLATGLNKPNGSVPSGLKALHEQETAAKQAQQADQKANSKYPGDDIGEFWHMEEPDDDGTEAFPAFDADEFEDDIGAGIGGRVSHTPSPKLSTSPSVADDPTENENEIMYTTSPAAASGTTAAGTAHEQPTPPSPEIEHVEFHPGSVSASQQPTNPGFRRPSVIRDPAYTGRDYTQAATSAGEQGIYGSSYARPVSKGSFTAGSLGESYMARHAEEMMRLRLARQQEGAKAQ